VARTVRWSEAATRDLEEAADFIARDSQYYAAALVRDARATARSLRTLAERGRIVPEARSSNVREIPVKSYRLIYWVAPDGVTRDEAQVLVATEAAGEGINLQFCWFMVNYDIPWNPVRLEQRMGRIHRYGQEHDCLIFNFVAVNTREGRVVSAGIGQLSVQVLAAFQAAGLRGLLTQG